LQKISGESKIPHLGNTLVRPHSNAARDRAAHACYRYSPRDKSSAIFYIHGVGPSDISSWIAIAKDAMTGIAAAVAAGVAVAGLKTWKRQLQGTATYDVSRRLLRSVYRLREEIRALRSPFMSGGEISSAMKAAAIDPPPSGLPGKEANEAAYDIRWRRVADAQVAFAAEILEAEALWGGSIRQLADELLGCTGQLYFFFLTFPLS
jgi:hypothetical protein